MTDIENLQQLKEELRQKIAEANDASIKATMELTVLEERERNRIAEYWKKNDLEGKCFHTSRENSGYGNQHTYRRVLKNGGYTGWGFSVVAETIYVDNEETETGRKTYRNYDLGHDVPHATLFDPKNLIESEEFERQRELYMKDQEEEAIRITKAEDL